MKFDAIASSEIKSTHSPLRRISSNGVGFHRRRRFRPPARVDLVEKPTSRNLSVFLVRETGLEPVRDYHTPLKRARLPIPPLSHICSFGTFEIIALCFTVVNTFFRCFAKYF